MTARPAPASVPCGGCTLCCRSGELILLTDDDIAPPGQPYLVQRIMREDGGEPILALAQREGGACVYVSPDGCRIHDHAPMVCKVFDCGAFYASRGRQQRRLLEAADPTGYHAELLAQGRRMYRLQIGLESPQARR